MRLTVTHLRDAAIIGGVSLIAFAAMRVTYLIGHDSPLMPATVSAIFFALWFFLLRQYGPRSLRPVDPRLQRVWFLSSIVAGGVLAVFALIAALWIRATFA